MVFRHVLYEFGACTYDIPVNAVRVREHGIGLDVRQSGQRPGQQLHRPRIIIIPLHRGSDVRDEVFLCGKRVQFCKKREGLRVRLPAHQLAERLGDYSQGLHLIAAIFEFALCRMQH